MGDGDGGNGGGGKGWGGTRNDCSERAGGEGSPCGGRDGCCLRGDRETGAGCGDLAGGVILEVRWDSGGGALCFGASRCVVAIDR